MTVENNPNVQQAKENAPGAVPSMVCGIISTVVCLIPFVNIIGIILGIIAIVLFTKSKKAIDASHGQLGGKGMAIAGLVCGIVGICFGLFYVLYYLVIGAAFVNNWDTIMRQH